MLLWHASPAVRRWFQSSQQREPYVHQGNPSLLEPSPERPGARRKLRACEKVRDVIAPRQGTRLQHHRGPALSAERATVQRSPAVAEDGHAAARLICRGSRKPGVPLGFSASCPGQQSLIHACASPDLHLIGPPEQFAVQPGHTDALRRFDPVGSDGRPAPIVPVQCGEEYRQNLARHFGADPVIGHQLQRFSIPRSRCRLRRAPAGWTSRSPCIGGSANTARAGRGCGKTTPALRHEEMQARADRVRDRSASASPAGRETHHFPSAIKAYSTGPANSRVPPPSAITRRTPSGSSTRTPAVVHAEAPPTVQPGQARPHQHHLARATARAGAARSCWRCCSR